MDRRNFLRFLFLVAASGLGGWSCSRPLRSRAGEGEHDVIVIGGGLGGLTCGAYLARSGLRTLVLEQHSAPGGYATSFARQSFTRQTGTRQPGAREFSCEVSLHASAFSEPSMRRMLVDLGVWDRLEFAPHPHAWVSHFPDFTLTIPSRAGLAGFERQLTELCPQEAPGLAKYFTLWRGMAAETAEVQNGLPLAKKAAFPLLYPTLWSIRDKTLGQLVDSHVRDPRLRAALTQTWGYYGLPPSRLSAFYYLFPTAQYLEYGGMYLKGTSQTLSNALADAVRQAKGGVKGQAGSEVRLNTLVEAVLVENGRAVGVRVAGGREHRARAVVCNASAPGLVRGLLPAKAMKDEERARLDALEPSMGSFLVWLGLDRDITASLPYADAFHYGGLDMEADYARAMANDFAGASFALMAYDKLVPGFSPPGCSTVSITALCGHDHWKPFEADYRAGRKQAYAEEKQRLANLLIRLAEERAIPGLSKMIVMREAATPLTNARFTLNPGGAIYGYNQTVGNSFMTRLPNETGVPGLYLASAWGNPGGGFAGAMLGGRGAFTSLTEAWG